MKIGWLTVWGLLLIANHELTTAAAEDTPEIGFNNKIRPLLSEYCFACHGPDSGSRKADLRLDLRESAIERGAVSPGDSASSELISRIFSDDPDVMMPPPETGKTLSNDAREVLRRWVDAGAEWEPHWAFIKPQRPELPTPERAEAWARNEIDLFVLRKLHELGLQPNGQEDSHLLARRAAFDLTGLPPAPGLLAEFFPLNGQSPSSPEAYEQYIDRLLTSQHAGEHRARYWLDAARYGDTHGMHVDNYREIWPYRDWVIRAFNSNMPFDQFVIEQIAGDLLPEPSLDQQIATGFSRCNITTSEGGAIPEELDVRYMVDRVETTSTVFLGLTAGCAVCHDHKYDPISQREFYQLGAFFNNTTQPAMDGNQKDTPPVVVLPAQEFKEEWEQLQKKRRGIRRQLTELPVNASEWWPTRQRDSQHPIAEDELLLWLPLTEGEGEASELPESATWEAEHPFGARGVRFGENSEFSVEFPQLRSDEPLTISFWFRTPDELISTTLFEQTQKVPKEEITTDKDKPEEVTVGWKITSGTAGTLNFEMLDRSGNDVGGRLPDNDALKPRTWQHVCVRYSGGQSTSSITILLNGRQIALRNSTEEHIDATELADVPLKIAGSLPTAGMSDVRIIRRWVNDEEVRLLTEDGRLKATRNADVAWDELEAEEREQIESYYRQTIDEDHRLLSRELAATQLRHDYIYSRSTTTLVMEERSTAPRAWVLQRGEYDHPMDEVSADVPAALLPLPTDVPGNRLALARWLVHPDHPLTARVTVNRLWQSVFGTGLVKTSEDFGIMGDRPSHPELLDWLAVEFIESGWDVNHMLKLMVTSAAYRQSCGMTPGKVAEDPENRFLSRGPRVRLDAEALRDQALAVSGLLQPDIGGPSVKPYQPAGLWNVVAITGSNTRVFKRDTGPALYRRSLYTFWKRTSPPPSMSAFNAPTREQCTVRRERTNTPLQALVLMNDPQFVEAARYLAEAILRRSADGESRSRLMYESVLCRPANQIDLTELSSTAAELRDMFLQNEDAARELIQTGETKPDPDLNVADLAAWTMVANILMNRDDFINK